MSKKDKLLKKLAGTCEMAAFQAGIYRLKHSVSSPISTQNMRDEINNLIVIIEIMQDRGMFNGPVLLDSDEYDAKRVEIEQEIDRKRTKYESQMDSKSQ